MIEETRYPWEGKITLTLRPEKSFTFGLNLRVPGWCRSQPSVKVNGKPVEAGQPVHGYLRLERAWKAGDVVELDLPMPVERMHADPHVKDDVGRTALQRGPVVYCLEGVDNEGRVRNLCLPPEAALSAHFEKDLLSGVVVLRGEALAVTRPREELVTKPVKIQAVPYFAWDNRQPGPMIVWIAESPERAEVPGEDGVVVKNVRIRASHLNPTDTLETLTDGVEPKKSSDHGIRRMTWWDHRGSTEWISYRYRRPRTFTSARVYWFDDTGIGACRVPAEWRLLYRDGDAWKPVKLTKHSQYGTILDTFNRVTFEPVETRELKLEVKLQPGFSGGVLKWVVASPPR